MESKNKSEFKVSLDIIKKGLKSSFKKHRALWIIGIIILVFSILLSVLPRFINQNDVLLGAVDMIMPDKLGDEDDEDDIVFYRELNPEYENSDTKLDGDNYIQIYNYYYIDEAGEKQYLTDGEYHYINEAGEEKVTYVALGFLYSAGNRIGVIGKVLTALKWIIIVGFIIAVIVVWYFKDKKHNEQNKPKRIRKSGKK